MLEVVCFRCYGMRVLHAVECWSSCDLLYNTYQRGEHLLHARASTHTASLRGNVLVDNTCVGAEIVAVKQSILPGRAEGHCLAAAAVLS